MKKILCILVVIILIIFIIIICNGYENNNIISITKTINTKNMNHRKEENINIVGEEQIAEARETLNLKEYENMPKEIEGYKVIGKISIPKINVEKYILEETSEKTLKLSCTKVCGPEINKTGNLCLAGHNYRDTFGYISSLEIGDTIEITDTYDRTVKYGVYKIDRVSPYDTSSLSQETQGEREITLITCTLGAIKRVVVKAVEIYD